MSSKLGYIVCFPLGYLFLFTSCGLFTKDYIEGDCKGRWKQFEQKVPSNYINAPQLIGHGFVSAVSANPANPSEILFGTETSGIFYTKNEGQRLKNRTDKLKVPFLGIRQIVRSSENPEIVFAATAQDSHLKLESYGQGVLQSTDGGKTWFRRLDVFEDSSSTFARRNVKGLLALDSTLYVAFDNKIVAHSIYPPYQAMKSLSISEHLSAYRNLSIHSIAPLREKKQIILGVSVFNRTDQKDLHTALVFVSTKSNDVSAEEPEPFKRALFTQISSHRGDLYFAQTAIQNSQGFKVPTRFELLKWKNGRVDRFYSSPIRNTYGQPFAGFGRAKHELVIGSVADTTVFFVGGYEVTSLYATADSVHVQRPNKTTHVDVRDIQLVKKGNSFTVYQANDGGLSMAAWSAGSLSDWTYNYPVSKPPQISEVIDFTVFDEELLVTGEMHNGIRSNGPKSVHLQAGDGGAICKSELFPNRFYGIVAYGTGAGVLAAFDKNGEGEWQRKASVSVYGREGLKASAPLVCYKEGDREVVVIGATRPIKATFGADGDFISREPVVIENFNPKSFAISDMVADVSSKRMYLTFGNEWACSEGICDFNNLWYSNDLGDSWLPITAQEVKRINPSSLCIDNKGTFEVFVAGANLSNWEGSVLNKVMAITGDKVLDMTYNLPNVPVFSLIQDNSGRLWAGTEYGVYYLEPNERSWNCYSSGLPPTIIQRLEIHDGYLWMGSYGRGVWRTKLPKVKGS